NCALLKDATMTDKYLEIIGKVVNVSMLQMTFCVPMEDSVGMCTYSLASVPIQSKAAACSLIFV
ncbi:hypothetical protein GLOTRDRAFT_50703, partial [Gloeophyllum trabeum ATCC 11539]